MYYIVRPWRSSRLRICLFAVIVTFLPHGSAFSQPPAPQEVAAVRQARSAYMTALQKGDIRSLKAAWASDGKYIDSTGTCRLAHDVIDEQFASGESPLAGDEVSDAAQDVASSLRMIAPGVCIEEGDLVDPADGESTPASGTYTAIWVKHGNTWLLDTVRESSADETSAPASPLKSLAWLIGEWTASSDGIQIHCTAEWTMNHKFIVRDFVMERTGREPLRGTQRIGWDPERNRIRSWEFDSEGGFSEGTWTQEGDAWTVKTAGVLPDGSRSSAANFWVVEGDDQLVVKIGHAVVGTQTLEDTEFEFRRVQGAGL